MEWHSANSWRVFAIISTAIGFAVDVITLLALVSIVHFPEVEVPEISAVPAFELGSITLGWQDITLVGLIYIGILFVVIYGRLIFSSSDPTSSILVGLFLFHGLGALFLFWAAFFVPFSNPQIYIHIAVAWLIGFTILLTMYIFRRQGIEKVFILCVIGLCVFAGPAMVLFAKGIIPSRSWVAAIRSVIQCGLAGIVGSLVLWSVAVLIALIGGFLQRISALH